MDVLNSLLDNLDEALFILDKDGTILLYNKAAAALNHSLFVKPFHWGDSLIDCANLETSLFIRDLLHTVIQTKEPTKTIAEFAPPNEAKVYLEFNFIPVFNEDDMQTHTHLFIRDITAQKIFEKKITTQATNMTNLIEHANAIIIGIDTRGYITEWNKRCTEVTGFEKDEAYAQQLSYLLLYGSERPQLADLIARGLQGEPVSNSEIIVHHKNGDPRILLLNGTSRSTTSGKVIGLLFVGQDITELTDYRRSLEMKVEEKTKALQEALKKEKEVVEMKNRFVSIASHEFRSPLASILFETQLIQGNKRIERRSLTKRLETIAKQTHHMNRLLDDVLTYGKSEAGKIQLVLSDIPLMEFLRKIVEEVHHRPEKHLVKTEYRHLPGIIRGDEKLLRSILINLLTNAIKFSPGKEQVYLIVDGSGQEITITVRDEGIGIPEDELTKIFEPFLRGKGVDAIQGTGLGLSIVKRSVELLNGSIKVKSDLNNGTTFSITIPALQP
jgi:PAS domain S-box-containing protein